MVKNLVSALVLIGLPLYVCVYMYKYIHICFIKYYTIYYIYIYKKYISLFAIKKKQLHDKNSC